MLPSCSVCPPEHRGATPVDISRGPGEKSELQDLPRGWPGMGPNSSSLRTGRHCWNLLWEPCLHCTPGYSEGDMRTFANEADLKASLRLTFHRELCLVCFHQQSQLTLTNRLCCQPVINASLHGLMPLLGLSSSSFSYFPICHCSLGGVSPERG